MDLVDIDKVLDDFELNEDKDNDNVLPKIINVNCDSTIENKHADSENGHQDTYDNTKSHPSTSNSNKNFVKVSNVFSSLNEYVNAGKEKTFDELNLVTTELTTKLIEDSSHSSDSMKQTNEYVQHKSKVHKRHHLIKSKEQDSSTSCSNSTSPGSSISSSTSSSRRSSVTTSPSSSDDEVLTKTNEKSLIHIPNTITEDNNQESNVQTSDVQTNSNMNNKSNTIFSSSSSYCYNENNSSDVTFSNDIVSLNETSSLSSIVNISNNENEIPEKPAIENFGEITKEANTKEFKKSNLVKDNATEGQIGAKKIFNEKKISVGEVQGIIIKPVVGFESTMDDVSDTELESYLQELEFETNSIQNQSKFNEDQDSGEVKEIIEKLDEIDLIPNNFEISEIITSSLSDDGKEKNVDNISQASTVECNEIVTSHTDFDGKLISSDEVGPGDALFPVYRSTEGNSIEGIKDNLTTDSSEDGAVSVQTINIEITHEVLQNEDSDAKEAETVDEELKLSAVIDDISDTSNGNNIQDSSIPKRPNTLNFPSSSVEVDEQITSPEQTPPLVMNNITDQILLSSSSEELTNSSVLNTNMVEDNLSSGLPSHQLGRIPPYWIPDSEASLCMHCSVKFSFTKRRHHCRACGKVLCSTCCSIKSKLEYLGDAEERICHQCDSIIKARDQSNNNDNTSNQGSSNNCGRSPNPNNPMEYCSRLPPHQQVSQQPGTPISVMVPVGVLKREGAPKTTRKEKNVIFSDGIRPGCDLTELDHSWDTKSSSSSFGRKSGSKRVQTPPDPATGIKGFCNSIKLPKVDENTNSYIPKEGNALPPIFMSSKTDFEFIDVVNNSELITKLEHEVLKFAIQRNFFVLVKILKLHCCINKTVINFTTLGMRNVGQDEIIILLELDDSNLIPKDIFLHLNDIYFNADKGQTVNELGFSMPRQQNFLGSKEHGGLLFIRPTFQCLQSVMVPESPYLIGILIHRWEVPWAKIFPLRLMLRLGALYRYYPSPHISERGRDSVYAEIAQTVINFLADFRTYSYTLATIRGMTIHMEDRKTTIEIPKNRYDQVVKAINQSSDHIISLGGIFSKKADGHLVCIQNTESGCPEMYQYSTQAINIQGQPRKVTGASFLILNGALKTASGLSGKCTIVEDGLMVQILPQTMISVREALKNMKDYSIVCGPIEALKEQTEVVSILWVENDLEFNMGVISPIDSKPMDGIPSIRVHKGLDYANNNHILRWTEVFILKSDEESPHGRDQVDVSKVSEKIARSTAVALVSFLDLLAANGLTQLALRVTLDPENVCYEAGSQQNKLPPLYMNALDNELIPTLHRQASNIQTDTPIILELIFSILDK